MNIANHPSALLPVAWLMLALATPAPAATPQTNAGPVVALPKIVVRDSRVLPPPESWRYGTIPGIEILSNAPDKATKDLISDFELFRQALGVVWPAVNRENTPVLLVLCEQPAKFKSFAPAHTGSGPATTRASLFLQGRTHDAIVIDMGSTVVNLLSTDAYDPSSNVDSTRFSIEQNKQLYREYVHYLLSKSQPRLPAWFEEGLSQIIMAMRFDRDYIEIGKLHDPDEVSAMAGAAALMNQAQSQMSAQQQQADQQAGVSDGLSDNPYNAPVEDEDFNAALRHRALMPMGKFFAVGHDSPIAQNPLGNNTWAKQAYAFVHMGLYGEDQSWQKPFLEFLVRSTREPVTEAMFKQCFHMSYAQMGIQLRGYIQSTTYREQMYRIKGGGLPKPPPLVLREATQAEVGRIEGDALLLGGHEDAARNEFLAPYVRGKSDPQLLAELGLLDHADGLDSRAEKFLAAAVAGHATDPDAYLTLARMRYAAADARPEAPDRRFSAAQEAGIMPLLLTARALPPPRLATYELMAKALVRSPKKLSRADLGPLIEGVERYPGNLRLVYVAAALCAESGYFDSAQSLVDHGLKFAPDPATRATFAKLAASLPPAPPTSAPAAQPLPAKKG